MSLRTTTLFAKTLFSGLLLAAAFALIPFEALADKASNVSMMTRNVGNNAIFISKTVSTLCYVIGTFYAATGLVALKNWMIDGDKVSVMQPIMRLFVAMFLIMLPYAILVATNTLFGDPEDAMPDVEFKTQAGNLNAFKSSK